MGTSSSDDSRPPRRNSQGSGPTASATSSAYSATSNAPAGSQVTSAQPAARLTSSSSAMRLMHKSPQKPAPPQTLSSSVSAPDLRDTNSKKTKQSSIGQSEVQELLNELHKEEKTRDGISGQLANPRIDTNSKAKLRAQFEISEEKIQKVRTHLLELGFDEDDDISSGDEEAANSSTFLSEEYYHLSEDDSKLAGSSGNLYGAVYGGVPAMHSGSFYQTGGGTSSAASSAIDLASIANPSKNDLNADSFSQQMRRSPSISPDVAVKLTLRILEQLNPGSQDAEAAVDKLDKLVNTVPQLKHELKVLAPWKLVADCIRPFLLEKNTAKVTLGIKLIGVFAIDANTISTLQQALLLDYFLVLVLAKDGNDRRNHELRAAAVELLRRFASVHGGVQSISRGERCALVAVAEQSGADAIRNICVETLAEMTVLDPQSVLDVGGLNVLMAAITEPGQDSDNTSGKNGKDDIKGLATSSPNRKRTNTDATSSSELSVASDIASPFAVVLMMILVNAADRSDIRSKFFRKGKDLSSILTPFTDVDIYNYSRKSSRNFMTQSSIAMQVCLRSWVGAICFDLNLFVQCMTLPSSEIQETLLNVLDGILWLPSSSPLDHASANGTSSNNSERLLNQFTAILLHRLQLLGLQEKLVRLQGDGITEQICRKAQQIGAKIFALSAKLIPSHAVVKQSMALPKELEEALAKAPTYSLPTASIALFGTEAELPSIATWRTAPSLQTFIRFGVNIDDFTFKNLIVSTHVLDTKMFRHWNWDALMELVQGPLRSPRRLEEVIKGSKFLKRLFAFYRPFKYRFSNVSISKDHTRYVEVGKELMKSLLETQEGVRYLAQNKLFRQIAECLAQLDPLSGIVSNEPLLSVRRFKSTLCCAYSELIGVLSRSAVGQQILAQIRIFNMFYRVCDINREDVIRSILCALDYRLEGHPRLILAKALTSPSLSVRLYATEFVGYRMATEEAHFWAIDLMVEQLYDVEIGVARAAAYGLHNMCAVSGQALDYTISLKPFLGHLEDAAEPLRILFMGRPLGFEILLAEFEHRDMNHWASGFNEAYVDKIEAYLETVNTINIAPRFEQRNENDQKFFQFPSYSRPSKRLQQQGGKLSAPPHFYGELALTDQGCRFLQSKGGLDEIKDIVARAAQYVDFNWSAENLRKIKGALWALGHVASRENGGDLFELSEVQYICDICRDAAVLSLRGTAYYVLGLFALSSSGAELLHQCKWDVVYNPYGQSVGVVLPPEGYYIYNDSEFTEADKGDPEEEAKKTEPKSQVRVVKAKNSSTGLGSNLASSSIGSNLGSHTGSSIAESEHVNGKRSRSSSVLTDEIHASMTPEMPPVEESDQEIFTDAEEFVSLPHRTHSPGSSHVFDFEVNSAASTAGVPSPPPIPKSSYDLAKENSIEELLSAIGQLCSSVHASTAAKSLVAMRASHADLFQSGEALTAVLKLISTGRYKQVIRRFILGLFDMHVCLEDLYQHEK